MISSLFFLLSLLLLHSDAHITSDSMGAAAEAAAAAAASPLHAHLHPSAHNSARTNMARTRLQSIKSAKKSSPQETSLYEDLTHYHISVANKISDKYPSSFKPQPDPYTQGSGPCTAYYRQDNCDNYPPLSPNDLPTCGTGTATSNSNSNATVFAVIGDYGLAGVCAQYVSQLLHKLEKQYGYLSFVLTTGDNAYWTGSCESYESTVGTYYSDYLNQTYPCVNPSSSTASFPHVSIPPSSPSMYESLFSANVSRFFPTFGNHDWDTYHLDGSHIPYFQYFPYLLWMEPFDPPAQGSFYTHMVTPNIQIFSLNSNLGKSDATPSEQALFQEMVTWLKSALMSSTAQFKFVFFHHPPFCTAQHDALAPWMDLPYQSWGATAVFSGHEHVYERLINNKMEGDATPNMPYIVNGLGGHPWIYDIANCPAYPGSQFKYNLFHGVQIGVESYNQELNEQQIEFCFYSYENGGTLVDSFQVFPTQPSP